MRNDHQVFAKMPERDSVACTAQQCTILRRSPRFLHRKSTPETQKLTTPPRKSQRPAHQKKTAAESENLRTPKSKLRSNGLLQQNNTPESEQPTTILRKSQRLVERKERAAQSENPNTPKSKPRGNNAVRSLNLSTSSKKSTKANAGSRESQIRRRSSSGLNQELVIFIDEDEESQERVSKKVGEFHNGSRNFVKSSSGSSKPRRLNNVTEGIQTPRRSSRLGTLQNVVGKHTDMGTNGRSNRKSKVSLDNEKVSGVGKDRACVNSGGIVPEKSKRASKRSSVGVETVTVEGGEGKAQELDCGNKKVAVRRKRKRDKEDVGVAKGWTKEQELALQRAYLLAKPTPAFWKQVSKLVFFSSFL